MAYLSGYSDSFDLDDDGILRDTGEYHWTDDFIDTKPGGILIDDDGIVRDDFDTFSKRTSNTHWTDSGLGGDKQSSTPSTLRQLDLQSYPSFEDVSHQLDESHVNISDLEASRDDLDLDNDGIYGRNLPFENSPDAKDHPYPGETNRSGLSSRSSFDHSLNFEDPVEDGKPSENNHDLFDDDYYRQMQELGVLVDGADLWTGNKESISLNEFEQIENNYSRDYDERNSADAIGEFLQRDAATPTRDSLDIEMPDNADDTRGDQSNFLEESKDFERTDGYFMSEDQSKQRTRPNTADSARTISSRSFPEISPEEAFEYYREQVNDQLLIDDATSIEFEASQKTGIEDEDDDDEIFLITSRMSDDAPKPAKIPAYDNENVPSQTPKKGRRDSLNSDLSSSIHTPYSRDSSVSSRSQTPKQGWDGGQQGNRTLTPSDMEHENVDDVFNVHLHDESGDLRPSSAGSQKSGTKENTGARPKAKAQGKKKITQKPLSHARSHESFLEKVGEGTEDKKGEKLPKRLLPKPTAADVEQSFKIKNRSKSTTNISKLTGPVKPTHMSLSDIRQINIDDDYDHSETHSTVSEKSKGELSSKLKQESSKRKQATELVQQLQQDYDKLLSKYAMAELTIDQLRLGAKISLHSESPTPSQATSGSIQSAQQQQLIQLNTGGPSRGMLVNSPFQTGGGSNLSIWPESIGPDAIDSRQPGLLPTAGNLAQRPRSESANSIDTTSSGVGENQLDLSNANGAEGVKLGLMFQAKNIDERMDSFKTLMNENQLTVEEQEKVFEKIRTDHEKLRRTYLQSKEDYNVMKRSGAATQVDVNFDPEKECEGELFRLGMKFDEIHEQVEEKLKEKASNRQPFQTNRRTSKSSESGTDTKDRDKDNDPSVDQVKQRLKGTKAGDDLVQPKEDSEFEKKLKRLHEEYNGLMDRYRRLKQMTSSPERDKEIDNLVRKLRNICHEEPDIFRLPPDLKESAAPYPDESWSLAEDMDRWESMKEKDREVKGQGSRSESRGQKSGRSSLNSSMVSNRSALSREGELRDEERTEEKHRRDSHGSYRPDDSPRKLNDSRPISGSYSSLSSRGRYSPSPRDISFNDRGSPVPSLPRPRRHDYPDRERRERRGLKKGPETGSVGSIPDSGIFSMGSSGRKKPDAGSTSSLPDSGISEHEGAGGASSALSNIPGPGKFKQMTGRREHDTDSGFIGSMVGSEVSNLSSARRQQQPLRLRQPDRPSSRGSSRSSDGGARAGTPSSIASSRHSRQSGQQPQERTPTKKDATPPRKQRESGRDQGSQSQQSRDYTDDSYTTVTESDMSFESEQRPRRVRRGSKPTTRPIEKIEEDSEEERFTVDPTLNETTDLNLSWISSESERPTTKMSQKSKTSATSGDTAKVSPVKGSQAKGSPVKGTPMKAKHPVQKQRPPSEDEDSTPRASPIREQDLTRDTYSSDEMTPRHEIQRENNRMLIQQRATTQVQAPLKKKAESQGPKIESQQPPTPRSRQQQQSPSLRQQQQQYMQQQQQQYQQQQQQQKSLTPERGRSQDLHVKPPTPRKMADKSVGSGSDETILASDAETAATRGSVNSERLKLIQDDLAKLREEFHKASSERNIPQIVQAPPPAPQPAPQNQYDDRYFDPTEDPYAFMRGPRRRANSFSGAGRQWDWDWHLPMDRQADGDIPLGYAAADEYAEPRKSSRQEFRNKIRERGKRRSRHGYADSERSAQTDPVVQNGYLSDQSPTRSPGGVEERVQGHYGYYIPHAAPPAQQPQETTVPRYLQTGKRVYGSQPNLAYTGYQPPPRPSSISGAASGSQGATRPLRQSLYSYAALGPHNRATSGVSPERPYAQDDLHLPRQTGHATFHPVGATRQQPEVNGEPGYGVYTSVCPMCGSSAYHTHGDYEFPPTHNGPIGYLVQNPADMANQTHREPRSRSRPRSRSANRLRHYSPDGHVPSRYFVREFNSGSELDEESESEVEVRHRRSRSAGRKPHRKLKHARKYKRVRDEDYYSDRGYSDRGRLKPETDQVKPPATTNNPAPAEVTASPQGGAIVAEDGSSAAEADLDESLHLVEEIDGLTRKMMKTVGMELSMSKRKKEFGSSYW